MLKKSLMTSWIMQKYTRIHQREIHSWLFEKIRIALNDDSLRHKLSIIFSYSLLLCENGSLMGCAWVIDYLWSISVLHYYPTPLHKSISIRKNKNIALSIKSIEIFGWNGNLVFYLGLPPPNLIFVRVKSFIYFGFGSIGSIW
jgi:hypothetical protein